METVRLSKVANRLTKEYSLGMKQRLGIAVALLSSPDLLILDEPTNGLDPSGIQEIRELIKELPKSGMSVIVSSHLLSEIDQMATQVGIINNGKMIFQDSIASLHQKRKPLLKVGVSDVIEAKTILNRKGLKVDLQKMICGCLKQNRNSFQKSIPYFFIQGCLYFDLKKRHDHLRIFFRINRYRGKSMKKLLWADQLKLKRSSLLIVVLLVPLLIIAYELVNLTYRSEYVEKQAEMFHAGSMWMYLLYDNSLLFGLGFPLAATLSASIIANIEHQANGWKQTLSFPVSRMRIYVSKFICLVVSLFISSTIFLLGMVLLGKLVGFEGSVPWGLLFGDSYSMLVTVLPIMAFQIWLSMVFSNQAFSILVGSVSSIMGLFWQLLNQRDGFRWLILVNLR